METFTKIQFPNLNLKELSFWGEGELGVKLIYIRPKNCPMTVTKWFQSLEKPTSCRSLILCAPDLTLTLETNV